MDYGARTLGDYPELLQIHQTGCLKRVRSHLTDRGETEGIGILSNMK